MYFKMCAASFHITYVGQWSVRSSQIQASIDIQSIYEHLKLFRVKIVYTSSFQTRRDEYPLVATKLEVGVSNYVILYYGKVYTYAYFKVVMRPKTCLKL